MAYDCRDVAIILRQLKFKKSQSTDTLHNERKKVFKLMFVLKSKGKDKIKSRSFRPLAKFISSTRRHYFLMYLAADVLRIKNDIFFIANRYSLRAILCKYEASYIGTISRSDSDFDEIC